MYSESGCAHVRANVVIHSYMTEFFKKQEHGYQFFARTLALKLCNKKHNISHSQMGNLLSQREDVVYKGKGVWEVQHYPYH